MPIVTKRKVLRIGEHSYAITLPMGWVKYYEIDKGDLLDVIVDSEILIKPALKK